MEEKFLNVSSSPHVRDNSSTMSIMRDVVIALIPATLVGIYNFGVRALLVILTTCVTCVLAEYIWQKCMKQPITTGDFSALLTGLLLALNLPATLPLWMCVIGGVFAIIIAKQMFGGLGQNFMNPALAGRCFLMLSFSGSMTSFVIQKGNQIWGGIQAVDGISGATPLMQVKEVAGGTASGLPDLFSMFLGTTGGTIGETSVVALLIGAIYLLCKRVISPKIPLIYIGTFTIAVAIYAATKDYNVPVYVAAHLCGGGLMLGAWFMATDYVTSPITSSGKVIYAIGLGLLTFVLRIFGSSTEGVSYSIIIMNLLVPLIERATVPKAFGEGAEIKDKKQAKLATKEAKKEAKKAAKTEDASEGRTFGAPRCKEAGPSVLPAGCSVPARGLLLIFPIPPQTRRPACNLSKRRKSRQFPQYGKGSLLPSRSIFPRPSRGCRPCNACLFFSPV